MILKFHEFKEQNKLNINNLTNDKIKLHIKSLISNLFINFIENIDNDDENDLYEWLNIMIDINHLDNSKYNNDNLIYWLSNDYNNYINLIMELLFKSHNHLLNDAKSKINPKLNYNDKKYASYSNEYIIDIKDKNELIYFNWLTEILSKFINEITIIYPYNSGKLSLLQKIISKFYLRLKK